MSNYSITSLFPFRRVKIKNFFQMEEPDLGSVYFVILTPDKRFRPICHECGCKGEGVHSWHKRQIRDLDILGVKCYVILNYRKINCPNCGIKVEKTDVTTPGGHQVTNRLARYIHELCQHMTVKEVAEHLDLHWETVKKIHQKFLEKEFGETDFSHSGLLAIDEVSFGKYHKYLTVVLDFKTGRVIWLGKGHKADTLSAFFEKMPNEKLKQIKAIAMDMWDPFIKAVREHCPQALIVFDKYHLIASYNRDVIDEVRRSEQRDKKKDNPKYKIYKGSRWLLLKNKENLKEKEVDKLEKLLEINENLSLAYILRDKLKELYEYQNPKKLKDALDKYINKLKDTNIDPLKKFAKKLDKYWYGIVSYALHPIHTSILGGVNNKIKEIKRTAFGYHDLEYFKLKVKHCYPGN